MPAPAPGNPSTQAVREEAAPPRPHDLAAPAHVPSGETGATVQQIIAGLEAAFPGWRVWRTTDAGTWWASRRGSEWMREPRTLAADTANGLHDALTQARAAI